MSSRGQVRLLAILAFGLLVLSKPPVVTAQSMFATLTGVVSDQQQAVVPGATVRLKEEQSGSMRDSTTNGEGYYTFASVSVGDFTYELTVEAKGFVTYRATGIVLTNGEKRNINVTLKIGATSETVEVTGAATSIVPVDSGEKSATLSSKELDNYLTTQGSNAVAAIGIMPGFAIANGTSNAANYNGGTIGINANGDGGSQSPLNAAYSYNGMPSNSLDIVVDGAHASDPGCNCDTPVNPNMDMVSEVKVLTSNFSAETQKGPAVVSTVAKSGGTAFHGSGFFYARNYVLNSNDSLNNASGVPRTENKYYYPGGTLGGPVLIPGTRFNKNRNKLFFFTGYEYFYQVLDTGLLRATVPTPGELQGNFSPAEISNEGNITASGGPPGQLNAAALAQFPGGMIPQSQIDPNMVALMKLYPAANANPNATGGYNYVQAETFNQNNVQWMTRTDYNISDNTKLFVRYNLQRETQLFPVGLWWRQTDQVPYPTPVEGKNRSDSVTASLTHVFSPTMTNEFIFAYTYIGFPNVFEDPAKVNRTNVGYTYRTLYNNGVAQIPSFAGSGGAGEAALVFNPGGFEAGGASAGLYADKWMPSVSDTVTKIFGRHTVKAGFYWEWIRNAQPANDNTNGYLQVSVANAYSLGNAYADLITGTLNSYNESSFNRINDIAYNTYEFFLQDSWKVTPRLTLELGLRFSHLQPWYDRKGFGFSIFDYATPMGQAMVLVAQCGILAAHSTLTFREGIYQSSIRREGDRSILSVTDGRNDVTVPLLYAFGSGKAGQTYVFEYDGALYESRVSFYSALGALDLTMGARNSAPDSTVMAAGQRIYPAEARECFGCHSTGGISGGSLHLETMAPGVGCRDCHSSADAHAAAARAGDAAAVKSAGFGQMTPEAMNELCGRCHRTWQEISIHGPRGVNNVRFQPYRLTNSRCYDSVDTRIRCTACHDPHGPLETRATAYDRKCTACHSAAAHGKTCSVGKSVCVTCHMPKVDLPGAHAAFTDHQIRIVRAGDPYPN